MYAQVYDAMQTYLVANFTHVQRVVVAFLTCVLVCVVGIFPCLQHHSKRLRSKTEVKQIAVTTNVASTVIFIHALHSAVVKMI